MPIFTAAATALLAGTALATSTFAVTAVATGLSLATSIGLSYAVQALSDKPTQATDTFGVQGKLAGGGDIPRSFGLGYHSSAGSLVYANTWGNNYDTPNAFLTQVIAVSDLPGERLVGLWVNGAKVTLAEGDADYTAWGGDLGYPVPEYVRPHNGEGSPTPHLFIRYYNGSQTAVDPIVSGGAASAERPWSSDAVGKGICYAVITAFNDENLWSGFPTFKFELSGVPLYDPSKDSTVGGSGSQIHGDPSTWGGDGDNFPAVQVYNILRGFSYAGTWLYGLQNTTAARLPVANWITQIAKCRATVIESTGAQPTYRTGGQINVDSQPVNAIEAFLTGCQGRIAEIGGFYKIHLGAPDSPTFTFSDDDILSSEQQTFRPFFALADSVNGIQSTYPDPAQGWNTATAPAYYRTDLEARDGNRRLMANPSFDFVPHPEQAQRLQKSAIEEAQRARGHTVIMPPAFWIVEPGDVGEWTSARNGYSSKQFRVDSAVDRANLDVSLTLTEVDPTDYDWNTGTDFTPVTGGGTISNPPAPQAIDNFDAQPYTLVDADGIDRRPTILISWGVQPGISAVQYEVRLASDGSSVTRGRSDRPTAGNLILAATFLPATDYQVRGQFVPSTPRDMLWSDWIDVTTPDVRFTLTDFDTSLIAQIATLSNLDDINEAINRIASIASDIAARAPLDKQSVRTQLAARTDAAFAEIEDVRTVAVTTEAAFASFETTATATWGSTTAFVTDSATAIATFDGYAAAQYAVTLNVNGYATGFNLVNGGAGTSAFVVVADKFQIQLPGYNGNAPNAVFTVGTVNGVAAVGINGANMYLDGTLNARAIVAGSITAAKIGANEITSASGVIGALSVDSISIADHAVTVPSVQNFSVLLTGVVQTVASFNLSVDTTGLSGKPITIYATYAAMIDPSANIFANGAVFTADLWINGTQQQVTGGYTGPAFTMARSIDITGTGGVVTVAILARAQCVNIANNYTITGAVFAVAAKR